MVEVLDNKVLSEFLDIIDWKVEVILLIVNSWFDFVLIWKNVEY